MGVHSESKTWREIKEFTIEDSIRKLKSVFNDTPELANFEMYIPFGVCKVKDLRSAAEKERDGPKNVFIVGNVKMFPVYTNGYMNIALVKLYHRNTLSRIQHGLTIDIRLNSEELLLIKDIEFYYEFKPNKILTISKELANLELSTVKENLNDFLFEVQKIVLKL